jgi:hypothetical protein
MEQLFKLIKENSALFITLTSAIGYLTVYEYELGQCTYYGIPKEFIEINVQTILGVISYAVIILLLYFAIFYVIKKVITNESLIRAYPSNAIQRIIFLIGSLIYLAGVVAVTLNVYPNIKVQIAIAAVGTFTLISTVMFIYNIKKKIQHQPYSFTIHRAMKIFVFPFLLLGIALFHRFIVKYGYFKASTIHTFYQVNSKPQIVLLKQYGDKLFCREFDAKTHVFKDSLVMINLAQTPSLKIFYKPIEININKH